MLIAIEEELLISKLAFALASCAFAGPSSPFMVKVTRAFAPDETNAVNAALRITSVTTI
jgi:hypothetical protein